VAMWTLGLTVSTDLPSIATTFLANGLDSPSLGRLAGMTQADAGDAEALWTDVLRELGLVIHDRPAAATRYAACVSALILSGDIAPYDGAKTIWRASLVVDDPSFHELDSFIYAASEHEERPEDRASFEAMIIQEAEQWVGVDRSRLR
jgi:hypothetical protein